MKSLLEMSDAEFANVLAREREEKRKKRIDSNKKNNRKYKNKRRNKRRRNRNSDARLFCLDYFSRVKYTSNVKLCIIIANETGWEVPSNERGRYKFMRRFKRERLNSIKNKIKENYKKKARQKKVHPKATNKDFYKSDAWKALRYQALRNSEGTCQCCGAKARDGIQLHVDHVKPRSLFPELALDLDNLQILCDDCNIGKDNIDSFDWRNFW